MNVDNLFHKYKREDKKLVNYIKKSVDEKSESGMWDAGVWGKSKELTTILMFEYATAIEKITKGKLAAKQVVDKLVNSIDVFRLGTFKYQYDKDLLYDGHPVTSDEYTMIRFKEGTAAQTIIGKDAKKQNKVAIALFNNIYTIRANGKDEALPGIDLNDLDDIRQTLFHEWTHIMAYCKVKASELQESDIVFSNGRSTYVNPLQNPVHSRGVIESYASNVHSLIQSDEEVTFGGISTIEIDNKNIRKNRIMHNLVDEGATEYITRRALEIIEKTIKHLDRYDRQVRMMGEVFEKNGDAAAIATYLTRPYEFIRLLESKRVGRMDMLHYVSNYLSSPAYVRPFKRHKLNEQGEIEKSIFGRIVQKIQNGFHAKSTITSGSANSDTSAKSKSSIASHVDARAEYIKRINSGLTLCSDAAKTKEIFTSKANQEESIDLSQESDDSIDNR